MVNNRSRSIHSRVVKYAHSGLSSLYKDLSISFRGYTKEQVVDSREKYGENHIGKKSTDSIWFRLRRAFINPFSVVLFVLACVSLITDIVPITGYSRNFAACFIILGMLILSGTVRFVQEMRSKKAIDKFSKFIYTTVKTKRDGHWQEIPAEELVMGDRISFHAGDRIPADVRLIRADDLFVSQSMLTGESEIFEKDTEVLSSSKNIKISDYSNTVFAGSAVIGGTGEGIVLAVGKDTVYGDLGTISQGKNSGFDKGANSISWVLIRFMAVLVPLVFITCGITKGNWGSAFLFSLSVAVGLTPEMLPMVINACLAKGSAVMGKKNTIVKNINAMQGFGSMDVLCVDKTGTLTGDKIILEYYMDLLGNEDSRVLDFAYLNSYYHSGVQNHLDQAVLKVKEMPGKKEHFEKLQTLYPITDEQPFDYEKKFAGVLVEDGKENLFIIKGSVEEVFKRCSYAEYKGKIFNIDENSISSVNEIVDEMQDDGMKVIAVAYKKQSSQIISGRDNKDFILIGYLAFFDAPKKSACEAVEKLKKLHVPIKVLTGDNKKVTLSVCRRLGIPYDEVLTGEDIDNMSSDELIISVEKTSVFTELSPKQKSKIVKVLQENGHTVGFLGDGMNDLPAIIQSDVGISAEGAAETVQEAADVILLKKDLNVLEEGILEGRKVFANMSKYIRITASSNFGNIFAIVVSGVFLPFFPMAAVQLLLLNLLYDVICLILPWDNVDEDIYDYPRPWSGKTLGRFMRFFGPISSVFDIATFFFLFFVFCPMVCGGDFLSLADNQSKLYFISVFQTGWFLESLWTQILILHLLRTKHLPFIKSRPAVPVLIVTVAGLFVLTALTFTQLGKWLGFTSLPPVYFAFLVVVVLLYLLFVTVAKARYVKKYHELI